MDNELVKFIDKLVLEKKMENLDPEVLKQVKSDLSDRLEDRINAIILEKMPPEKLVEFEKLLDSDKEEETQKFCQKNIPNLDEVIAQELIDFRAIYLNL